MVPDENEHAHFNKERRVKSKLKHKIKTIDQVKIRLKQRFVLRISMASGRAPSTGRKRSPMIPGPRISNKSSLPLDKYVTARNIR